MDGMKRLRLLLVLVLFVLGACTVPLELVVSEDGAAVLVEAPYADDGALPAPETDLIGGSRAAGDTNFTNVVTDGFVKSLAATEITVAMTGNITPLGTYQPLTAAGAVGTSDVTVGEAGELVIFVNTSSNAITITDTGTLKLSGNAVLGQYDTLMVISDGTNWIEVVQTDN